MSDPVKELENVRIGFAAIAEIICLMTYFRFGRNILTSTKLLFDKGIELDEVANDLDNANVIGKIRKIRTKP